MPPDESGPDRLVLLFQIAGHTCAIDAAHVSEVLLFPALTRSPAQPALLDGFLNLRGTAVPVVPLHGLFGLPIPVPEVHTPLMVLSLGHTPLAVRVDRVEDVSSVTARELKPHSGQNSFNDCAEAQFTQSGREVILLSPERLLLTKERRCLDQLRDEEQRRLDQLGGSRG